MTVNDYISQKFQTFGITLSEADLLDMCLSAGVSGGEAIIGENHGFISVAIAKFIPNLLLRATSISESGFSMSWDTKGLRDFYSWLCIQYGLKDELNEKPKVTFL